MSDYEGDAERMGFTITPGREPATDFDTSEVQRRLRRMPFAGEIMAPHVRAVEQDPLPPINEKGFRECEGWVAVYEAVVQESWINGMGGLHGGAAAWLVDMITGASFARLRVPPGKGQGPSISIDMNYYNAAPAGTRMRVEVTIDKMAGSLSTARCVMSDWDSGRRICAGMHTTLAPKNGRKRASKL